MAGGKIGNPAVVGLAGFGGTTLLLNFHNIGLLEIGPIIWMGLIFGGAMQMIAGFQEQKTGNNFGYSAFCSYGAFWIALALIFLGQHYEIFPCGGIEVGYFLLTWTIYTFIMWIGSWRTNGMLATTFTLLLLGFIFLDLAHFTAASTMWTRVAGYDLILCALCAWYVMAHIIYQDEYGRDVLPAGKPWAKGSN